MKGWCTYCYGQRGGPKHCCMFVWVFPKIGVGPQNGWFIMVPNPIEMDDLGVCAYFWKHPFGFIMLLFHGMEFGFSFRFSSLNA